MFYPILVALMASRITLAVPITSRAIIGSGVAASNPANHPEYLPLYIIIAVVGSLLALTTVISLVVKCGGCLWCCPCCFKKQQEDQQQEVIANAIKEGFAIDEAMAYPMVPLPAHHASSPEVPGQAEDHA
ncbi:hypothetical protein F4810DRAFT_709254 [Camillea tinctor]|nr:hypothetical protein F4810DRAFT_709254 [Camillea tinctor]